MRAATKNLPNLIRTVFVGSLFLNFALAQAPPTKEGGASNQNSPQNTAAEENIPLDKFDVLALMAGSFSNSYVVAQIEQRGVTFVLDPVFVDTARRMASPQVFDALRKAHVRIGPDHDASRPKAYMSLVKAVKGIGQKDYAAADAAYQEAIGLEPNSAALHRARAFELVMVQKYTESETEARLSLKLEKNDAEAHCILSVALLSETRDAEAADEARESLRLFPSEKSALITLGMALNRSKQYTAAIPVLRKGIAESPGMPLLHKHLGVSLFYTGDSEGAITEFRLYLATEPNDAEAYYELGAALRSTDRNYEALAQFQKAATLDPNNPIYSAAANPDGQPQPPPNGEHPEDGFVMGHAYTNRFFGFSVEFPKEWNVLDEDTARSILKMGAALLTGKDPIQRDAMQAGAKMNRPLLFVMEGRSNSQVIGMRFFAIECIRVQGLFDPKSGKDYLELFSKSSKELNIPIQGTGEYEQVSLGGKEFWKTGLTMQFAAGPQTIAVYATLSKGYVLILHLQSTDPQGLDVLKNILQTVKFTDAPN